MLRAAVAAVALLTAGAAAANAELDAAFERDVLIINASQHACYRFDIWLATSRGQQTRGLMHVRDLPMSSGMLFVYEDSDFYSMWMKNTYISLDIAFARADGSIANIARDTEPLSLRSIASSEPVNYVLELNAGVTAKLSIDEHSRLLWGPTFDH